MCEVKKLISSQKSWLSLYLSVNIRWSPPHFFCLKNVFKVKKLNNSICYFFSNCKYSIRSQNKLIKPQKSSHYISLYRFYEKYAISCFYIACSIFILFKIVHNITPKLLMKDSSRVKRG